jgi:peptidylprolyl isomerase
LVTRLLLTLAAVLALLLAACGDDDDDDDDDDDGAEPTATADEQTGDPCPGEDKAGDGAEAATGDTVRVHYCGTLDDGSQFDTSEDGDEPLEFTLGASEVVDGFDAAVTGMLVGERKTVTIPAEEAYGEHDPELVQEFPLANFGETPPEIGQQVQANNGAVGVVVAVDEEVAEVDFNHRLAGEELTFEIELVEIVAAP